MGGTFSLFKPNKLFYILSILAILFPASLYYIIEPVQGRVEPTPDYEIVCDQEYFEKVSLSIEEATRTIYVVQFLVAIGDTVAALIDGLVDARDRGVEVYVLLDEGPEYNVYAKEYMEQRGLQVRLDGNEKTIHSKILIIDNETLIIGSTNWSDNSIDNNNEANALIKDPRVAAYFERYFWNVWADSSYDMELGYQEYNGVVPLVDRDYLPCVIDTINSASARLYILMYAFKLGDYSDYPTWDIFNAIVNASNRGVEVKIVLEKSDWEDYINEMNLNTIDQFKDHGIEAYFEDEHRISHTKVMVVDDTTILGSTNWAYSGLELYHSANIKITNSILTSNIIDCYSDIWNVQVEEDTDIQQRINPVDIVEGGMMAVRGYLFISGERMTQMMEMSYQIFDMDGNSLEEPVKFFSDSEGNYNFTVQVPDESGEYQLRTTVIKNGMEFHLQEVFSVQKPQPEKEDSHIRIIVTVTIFSILGIICFLLALLKKER